MNTPYHFELEQERAKTAALLAALEGCLAYFEDMKNAHVPDRGLGTRGIDYAPDEKWLEPVRAAIRHAKGERA